MESIVNGFIYIVGYLVALLANVLALRWMHRNLHAKEIWYSRIITGDFTVMRCLCLCGTFHFHLMTKTFLIAVLLGVIVELGFWIAAIRLGDAVSSCRNLEGR